MSKWTDDAWNEITKRFNDGEDPENVIDDVRQRFGFEIAQQWGVDMLKKLDGFNKKQWEEPKGALDQNPDQLSFDFGGQEFAIPDWPVRVVEDGEVRFLPARLSNHEQRQRSHHARIEHHRAMQVRVEAESTREVKQNAEMELAGLNTALPFEQLYHESQGTRCWRCLGGWRYGDPFERGHSDAPRSQGGNVTEWEHRSCNRSSRDNPVARPLDDTDA